jgi:hypothetical protein
MVFSAVDEAVNVSGIMRGNNVAVLAYGPTGSGKVKHYLLLYGNPSLLVHATTFCTIL